MELFKVTDNVKHKVRGIYNVTEESIGKDIQILKEWMAKQPHLPQELPYDEFLEKVLLHRKFSVERAKETIENIFTMKTFYDDVYKYFDNFDFSQMNYAIQKNAFLPKVGPSNERILIVTIRKNAPPYLAHFLVNWLAALYIFYKHDYSNGLVIVLDMEYLTLDHLQACPVHTLYKLIQLGLNGYGLKLTAIHILNMKNYLEFIVKYIALLKPKIGKRIFYHKNTKSLSQHIPLEYLPVEMGGENGSLDKQTAALNSFIVESKDELYKFAKMRTDENKRIGEYLKPNELFGCEVDNFLEKALWNRKFSVERAKESIERIFTLKTLYKDVFDFTPTFDYSLMNVGIVKAAFLEKLGPNNERILSITWRTNAVVSVPGFVTAWIALLYLYYKYDYSNGVTVILDFENLLFSHVQLCPVHVIYKLVQMSINAFGLKIHAVLILNSKRYVQFAIKYISYLKPKLGKKISYHDNINSLTQHIPLEYLPVDMGGQNGLIDEQTDAFDSLVIESQDDLKIFANITTDESLRVGEYLNPNELFGCEGTFKQLNLD